MSLDGAYDPTNIFAKILRGEAPAAKVYEDDQICVFMDAFPQSPGHVLVIPKTPARNLLDAPPEMIFPLMSAVQRVATAVHTALAPDGIIVTQFNGASAGQTVFHLHVHIIPRYEGQALHGHGRTSMADMATLQAQAARIAAAL
jgi:histidine triad (HIT) family protein